MGESTEQERPVAVDEIVSVLQVEAYILLGIGCVILIFDMAANTGKSIALDIWGVPGLGLGIAGALLVKLARDFRKLRRWTLPYVAFVLELIPSTHSARNKLNRADVRAAFERQR